MLLTSRLLELILFCNFSIKKLLLDFIAIELFLPVQLIIKKLFIILFLILCFPWTFSLHSSELIIDDFGIITIMYHRFEENKYPSTNIKMVDFINHLQIIKENGIKFVNPSNFEDELNNYKNQRKVLVTIDDGYQSFYNNAWPILKESKIPFILFISTREVGKKGYMSWEDIREISKYNFVEIGNHSHTHEYLVDENKDLIKSDIEKSISIFKKELGRNSYFFSYPFGEYSLQFKDIIKSLGFKYAFGQHSGVMDETKDFYELPRFPINEKYGEIKRFTSLTKTLPFKYKKIFPQEKYLLQNKNPPMVKIKFHKNIKNLQTLNCYSNEGGKWRNSDIKFEDESSLLIHIKEKFVGERGRINCSLRDPSGFWRWLGIQFVIAEN